MSSTTINSTTPVLISGAGPTGLFAAILLTKLNIPVRLIERHLEVSPLSKALVVHARTMEIMAMSGIIDRFLIEGHHLQEFHVWQGGKQAAVFPVLNNKESHYNFGLFLEQIRTTALLTAELNDLGIQIDRGWELMDTKVVEEGKKSWVETTIRRAIQGTNIRSTESKVLGVVEQDPEEAGKQYETEIVRSEYLIATDGGKSVVRHKLNIAFPGRTLDNNLIIFDGRVDSTIPFNTITMVNGENNRMMAAFPLHDDQVRILVDNGMLTPEEHNALKPEDLTLEKFTSLAQAILGPNVKFQPKDCSWLTYYRVNERHAEHFDYKGRIFLAGDASHVHSPAGGQGMNTGLQDSYNLTWKLALVLHGLAPKSILGTFELERKPVAEGIIKLSATLIDNGLAKDFLRRALKKIMIAVGPYLFPYLAPSTNPVSMLLIRYHDNAINQRHKSQLHVDEEFQVGQRAREGDLEVIKKNPDSGLFVGSAEDKVRIQELTVGPGIFHVIIFCADTLVSPKPLPPTIKGIESTTSEFLAGDIDKNLLAWRTKWFYKSRDEIIEDTQTTVPAPIHHSQSVAPARVSTASPSAIPCPIKASQVFMVHVLTAKDVTTSEQSAKIERLVNNQPGEGKIYLDQSGVVHEKYGVVKHGAGAMVVVRPDGHIGYRVLGIGHGAWEDVDQYFRSVLA